jgi:hypothetical protein
MAKKPVHITEPVANPPVTLTPEALKALMDEIAALKAQVQAKPVAQPAKETTSQTEKNIIQCKKLFAKAGYENVVPNVTVKTFNKWVKEDGMRPREGEHSIVVGKTLRLFHISQLRKLTKDEMPAYAAKMAEREAKYANGPTAAKLPPVELVPAAKPAKKKAKAAPIQPTA